MTLGNDCISPESLLTLLKERRSIRRYRPDPAPDEMVEQLLEAGRWMKKLPPTCANTAFAYEYLEMWRAVALHRAPGDIYSRNFNPTTNPNVITQAYPENAGTRKHGGHGITEVPQLRAFRDSVFHTLTETASHKPLAMTTESLLAPN